MMDEPYCQKKVVLVVSNTKFTVPLDEAIAIRDSLCVRFGCPSFCNGVNKQRSKEDKIFIDNIDLGA